MSLDRERLLYPDTVIAAEEFMEVGYLRFRACDVVPSETVLLSSATSNDFER